MYQGNLKCDSTRIFIRPSRGQNAHSTYIYDKCLLKTHPFHAYLFHEAVNSSKTERGYFDLCVPASPQCLAWNKHRNKTFVE